MWTQGIGVIIYELYFKRPPFNGNNAISIYNMIKNQGEKLIKKTGYYKLDDLIQKLLIVDPIKRLSWDEYLNYSFFKDEISLTYKVDGKEEIKILGKQFVKKNKNICKTLIKIHPVRLPDQQPAQHRRAAAPYMLVIFHL